MYLPALSNRELAHHADVTFDALAATDLQTELAKRFNTLLEEAAASADVLHALNNYGIDGIAELTSLLDKARALDERANGLGLLDVLREHEIDDPAELKKILDRDAKLTDVLDSLAQPMADLQALATSA